MYETEGLLGDEPAPGFRKFCKQVVDYCKVESFYIYTVSSLVQSND